MLHFKNHTVFNKTNLTLLNFTDWKISDSHSLLDKHFYNYINRALFQIHFTVYKMYVNFCYLSPTHYSCRKSKALFKHSSMLLALWQRRARSQASRRSPRVSSPSWRPPNLLHSARQASNLRLTSRFKIGSYMYLYLTKITKWIGRSLRCKFIENLQHRGEWSVA